VIRQILIDVAIAAAVVVTIVSGIVWGVLIWSGVT
jgi:hypothetical protein